MFLNEESKDVEEPKPVFPPENIQPGVDAAIDSTDAGVSEKVEVPKEPEVQLPLRTITCDVCGKIINCKDEKFDYRVMKMHKNRWHKENAVSNPQ